MDNYPDSGRLIVVANHTGVMETLLMTSFAHRPIEYMGSVDIPHESLLAFFMNAYQFIPVFRGNVSPSAMRAGLDILEQDGVIGIFPEGGIWEPAIRKAQSGVAWLSYHGNAPILPIGFSSTAGQMKEAITLRRPSIKMKVGNLIPPVKLISNIPKKLQFEKSTQSIMDSVWALLPEEELAKQDEIQNEEFQLAIKIVDPSGKYISIPKELKLNNTSVFSKILYRSTLINNFRDNLKINIAPLKNLHKKPSAQEIFNSTDQILRYLETDNPYYFTYRYGQAEGRKMNKCIQEIHELAFWASKNNYALNITPIRKYSRVDLNTEIIETHPVELKKW